MQVTASLVLYHNPPEIFEEAIRAVVESDAEVLLSIVDNSTDPIDSDWFDHPRVRYRHNGRNIGFGAGHNKAFAAVADRSDVHFFVNPDVAFDRTVMGELAAVFARTADVMAAMPSIYDEEGQRQNLCKALPNPIHLFVRRFIPLASIRRAIDATYEFKNLPAQGLTDIPSLSGCFLAVRSPVFAVIGGFDERFFMYMEDVDLVRRLGDHGRTVHVPAVWIRHGHARSSYRLGRLMFIHIGSAIRYFVKWGWWHDPVRKARNMRTRHMLRCQ